MFSGIVEGVGRIEKITLAKGGARLLVRSPFSLSSTKKGESIAVNGCCLTVAAKRKNLFEADLSGETLRVTNLGKLKVGNLVNLERPLRMNDRIGGHLVQGHVDGVGKIVAMRYVGANLITIQFPKHLRRYLIPKGSIAVDGISMTVNRLSPKSFSLVVIPHTLRMTNLKAKRAGDLVNLEVDLTGKYLATFFDLRQRSRRT